MSILLNWTFIQLFLVAIQCSLVQSDDVDEKLKWPDKGVGSDERYTVKDMNVGFFDTYIGMYFDERSQEDSGLYRVYRMNKTHNIELFSGNDSKQGQPMKLWQAFIDEKEYLVWIRAEKVNFYRADIENTEIIEVNSTHGLKPIKNAQKAFVVRDFLVVGNNTMYDMRLMINEQKVEPIDVVSNTDLNEFTRDFIKYECFFKDQYCAPLLPGTWNSDERMIREQEYELTMFFHPMHTVSVKHGEAIGLKENNRYYYYLMDDDKYVEYYIPQDLNINDGIGIKGKRVMLFPYVHLEDFYSCPYVDRSNSTEKRVCPTVVGQQNKLSFGSKEETTEQPHRLPTDDPDDKYYPEYKDGESPNMGFSAHVSSIHQMILFVWIYWLFN